MITFILDANTLIQLESELWWLILLAMIVYMLVEYKNNCINVWVKAYDLLSVHNHFFIKIVAEQT